MRLYRTVAQARCAAAEARVSVGQVLAGIVTASREAERSPAVERSDERIDEFAARAAAIIVVRIGAQVITPRHTSPVGVAALNLALCFNGETGNTVEIDPRTLTLRMENSAGERLVDDARDDWSQLQLAYAITSHRAQSSNGRLSWWCSARATI